MFYLELFEMESGVEDSSVPRPFLTVVARKPKGDEFTQAFICEFFELAGLV
jgi:hypothetical protein